MSSMASRSRQIWRAWVSRVRERRSRTLRADTYNSLGLLSFMKPRVAFQKAGQQRGLQSGAQTGLHELEEFLALEQQLRIVHFPAQPRVDP